MKLLILSDIHANWNALEAVLASESYGGLVFLGDAVDFGPDPGNCVKFLMSSSKRRFWAVRGDHDHGMAYGTNSKCTQELRNISAVSREWGEGYLTSGEVGFLRRLPVVSSFSIDGADFEMAHGSDRGPLQYESYNRGRPLEDNRRRFILVGHSHKPFIMNSGSTTIINPGSVGQPRDFNPGASYAVIEDGEARIGRASYDIGKTVKGLEKSSMPAYVKAKLISVLLHGGIVN
jgi:putative phosphoesterase